MFLLLRMSLSSGFNVALPPSTVHLPEMFWVSGVMVTRICKRGGAKLPSHRAKVFCHHYVSCDHTVRGGVGRVRGGRGDLRHTAPGTGLFWRMNWEWSFSSVQCSNTSWNELELITFEHLFSNFHNRFLNTSMHDISFSSSQINFSVRLRFLTGLWARWWFNIRLNVIVFSLIIWLIPIGLFISNCN